MKKAVLCVLSALMIFTGGCTNKSEHPEIIQKEMQSLAFDNVIAIGIASNFMQALSIGDVEGMRSVSTPELSDGLHVNLDDSIKVTGVRMEESTQKGIKGLYKYTVAKSKEGSTLSSLETYYLNVSKEDGEYRVSSCKSVPQYEVFKEGTQLKMRKDDNVEINNVIKMRNVPNAAYSKSNKGDIDKLLVPTNDYGVVGISFTGQKVAATTVDANSVKSYICLIDVDDAKATIGQNTGQGGESNGEEASTKEEQDDKDKLIGKKITTLDIYKDAKVANFMFSKDDAYVAVNYDTVNGVRRFKFYQSRGDLVDLKLEETFNEDEYNLVYKDCKDNYVYFEVTGVKRATEVVQNLIGSYKISTKDFKLTKL